MAELFRINGFKIALIYYGMEGINDNSRMLMTEFWDDFVFVRSEPIDRMSKISSWGIDDWCPDTLVNLVVNVANSGLYSAIVVNYVWMSRVIEGVRGPTKIIDTHDVFGGRHEKLIEQQLDPRWFFTTQEEEAKGLNRADVVIAIQDDEARYLSSITNADVITVGYLAPPSFLARSRRVYERTWKFGYIASANR